MTTNTYEQIALRWQPDIEDNKRFNVIVALVLVLFLALAIAMSLVDVPEEQRERVVVPDRVAQYIKNKPKPPPPPEPEPKPEPKPPPEPKPVVEREKVDRAPLTEEEKAAREKAQDAGILAFAEEFSDLIDSSAVDAAVATDVRTDDAGREQRATVDTDGIIASAGQGSGGVDSGKYAGGVGTTNLTAAEIAAVKQSLMKDPQASDESERESAARTRGDNVRTEEEVIVVIDRKKGQLQALYDRERRKRPGLQGKIVFEVSIAPEGNVTNVRIVSSELDHPALERRLVARIKLLTFEAKEVEPVTVTFPIEFLPS